MYETLSSRSTRVLFGRKATKFVKEDGGSLIVIKRQEHFV